MDYVVHCRQRGKKDIIQTLHVTAPSEREARAKARAHLKSISFGDLLIASVTIRMPDGTLMPTFLLKGEQR